MSTFFVLGSQNNMEKELKCPICGKIFKKTGNNQKYCSRSCCSKAYNRRNYYKRLLIIPKKSKCPICGNDFEKYNNNQKYCSKKCRKISLQKRSGKYNQNYWKKNKEIIQKKRRKEKEKFYQLIGNKCIICGNDKRIAFHEKNGKEHKFRPSYYLEHFKDFITLCYFCHKTIHRYAVIKSEFTDELVENLRRNSK